MDKLNIYKTLGNTLINQGIWFLEKAFGIQTKEVSSSQVLPLLSQVVPTDKIYFCDQTYFYTTLEKIKDILKYDLVNDKKWVAEYFDCDDFSLTIRANFREYYGLNCVGEARMVELRNTTTNAHIGWHRANFFFAEEGGVLKTYLLEAQNDIIVEVNKDNLNKITIGNWRYIINSLDF